MTNTHIHAFSSASVMLDALRCRRISAVELLDLHLRRIEQFNPALNAFVFLDSDHARTRAQRADEARARGDERVLLGLPITIKDAINVWGLPTISGVANRAEHRAEADAPVVSRLREAGAIVLGKTNVPPNAGDWQTDNRVFGRTNNPWDPDRTPGGSTGGGAAAVAAGLSPLEFGSDIGGSIRIPAAFCGVYGHRPSESLLPTSGHVPGPSRPQSGTVLRVLGPLARDARDLEMALHITAGPDAGEDVAWRVSMPAARHDRLSGFRVAILPPVPWQAVDADITAALQDLADRLRSAGSTVAEAQPDSFGDLRAHHALYMSLMGTMFTYDMELPAERRHALAERLSASGDEFLQAYARGLTVGAHEFLQNLAEREVHRAAYRRFFSEWDILLTPTTITPAFAHDATPFHDRELEIGGHRFGHMRLTVFPGVATLSGGPATAFPAGLTRMGLPIGLQAVGPYLEDATTIRFASLVTESFGGYTQPPGFEHE